MSEPQGEYKVERKSVADLQPDPQNVNKHTQRGYTLVDNSIRKRGLGRGIVAAGKGVEKPVIIAGNLTHEVAGDAGIEDVIFVHTSGDQLVVTVRDDIAPGSAEAIALGIEDNSAAHDSYNPDLDILAAVMADPAMQVLKEQDKILAGIVEGMGLKDESGTPDAQGINVANQYGVIVMCDNEAHQEEVYNSLLESGYKVKVVVV